jgi:hypothetical protein
MPHCVSSLLIMLVLGSSDCEQLPFITSFLVC